jgi:hypothetical protein
MICWFQNHSNNISKNTQDIYLLSRQCTNGMYVVNVNFRETISFYAARRLLSVHPWQIHDDVYLSPKRRSTR